MGRQVGEDAQQRARGDRRRQQRPQPSRDRRGKGRLGTDVEAEGGRAAQREDANRLGGLLPGEAGGLSHEVVHGLGQGGRADPGVIPERGARAGSELEQGVQNMACAHPPEEGGLDPGAALRSDEGPVARSGAGVARAVSHGL